MSGSFSMKFTYCIVQCKIWLFIVEQQRTKEEFILDWINVSTDVYNCFPFMEDSIY